MIAISKQTLISQLIDDGCLTPKVLNSIEKVPFIANPVVSTREFRHFLFRRGFTPQQISVISDAMFACTANKETPTNGMPLV